MGLHILLAVVDKPAAGARNLVGVAVVHTLAVVEVDHTQLVVEDTHLLAFAGHIDLVGQLRTDLVARFHSPARLEDESPARLWCRKMSQ